MGQIRTSTRQFNLARRKQQSRLDGSLEGLSVNEMPVRVPYDALRPYVTEVKPTRSSQVYDRVE